MLYTSFFQKADSLAAQLLSGGTSATLQTGNFGSPSGKQIMVIDRAVAGKAEVVSCNIAGTAITNMTRGLAGTVAVQHEIGATFEFVLEPTLFNVALSQDGWKPFSEAVTRVSDTQFTVPADVTSVLSVGDKLKFTDTTTKYMYVRSRSFGAGVTTVNITGGSDFVLAANPTASWFSKEQTPAGFPSFFNYSPTVSGFSAAPASTINRFWLDGVNCTVLIMQPNSGTSNATSFTITNPLTSATLSGAQWGARCWETFDNGAFSTTADQAVILSNTNDINIRKNGATLGWTAANGKRASFQITYQIPS